MTLPTTRLKDWISRLNNHNAQREYYLTSVLPLALEDKIALASVKAADRWEILGVNSKEQLAQLERIYQRRLATRLMDAGVTLADPQRLDVRGSLACGADVRIDVNCVFEGEVKLADGVQVGAHCVIRDTEIGAGTRIEPFSHIDSARIGADCRVGPYARLRPGARLKEEVHIGNFVEVKESDIGARSKANHLAYVGDTTVGRRRSLGGRARACDADR